MSQKTKDALIQGLIGMGTGMAAGFGDALKMDIQAQAEADRLDNMQRFQAGESQKRIDADDARSAADIKARKDLQTEKIDAEKEIAGGKTTADKDIQDSKNRTDIRVQELKNESPGSGGTVSADVQKLRALTEINKKKNMSDDEAAIAAAKVVFGKKTDYPGMKAQFEQKIRAEAAKNYWDAEKLQIELTALNETFAPLLGETPAGGGGGGINPAFQTQQEKGGTPTVVQRRGGPHGAPTPQPRPPAAQGLINRDPLVR